MLVVLGVTTGFFDTIVFAMPSGTDSGHAVVRAAAFPLMLSAIVVVGGLVSPMSAFEEIAVRPMWHWDLGQLTASVVVVGMVQTSVLIAFGHGGTVSAAFRNLLFWMGIALLGAALFGRRLAWLTPLAVVGPLVWFGYRLDGTAYDWAIPFVDRVYTWHWLVIGLVFALEWGFPAILRSVLRLWRRACPVARRAPPGG